MKSLGRDGTVKLTKTAHGSASRLSARARSASARHRIPHPERLPSRQPVESRPQQMSAHPEKTLYEAVHGREALHLSGRLEAPHLALAHTPARTSDTTVESLTIGNIRGVSARAPRAR